MCLEVVCECRCLTNASIGRYFSVVCGNPLDFAGSKPFFGGFCLNSTFKNRKKFSKNGLNQKQRRQLVDNRSIFLIKIQKKQPAAYSLPFSPTAEKAEQSYQVRSFCMATLQFLSHPSLIHRGNQ